jgi:hypothetical protein
MPEINRAGFDFFVSQRGVAEELSQPFVEPDRQAPEIQAQKSMRVFMVESVEWILPFGIQPQKDVILVFPLMIDSSVTDVTLRFPFLRQESFIVFSFFAATIMMGCTGSTRSPANAL